VWSSRRALANREKVRLAAARTALCVLVLAAAGASQDLKEAARLDAAGQCEPAERHYRLLLEAHPDSPAVLNNAGNHYLLCGQAAAAQGLFEKLLRLVPNHPNASLQLARLAVERRDGARALEYLAKVKDAGPQVTLLRAEALYWSGKRSEAGELLEAVERASGGEPRLLYLLGLACGRMGLYGRAESAFQGALARRPGDFDLLLQLGRAAARAEHFERAQRALETALKIRPGHVDVLVELGKVCAARQDSVRAVFYLAQAREKAPEAAEIILLLARAAEDAGYYEDAAAAYDDYLRLRPSDEAARRDRARACGNTHSRREEARQEIQWYLARHPDDPLGHYAFAQIFWNEEPEAALAHLTEAVRLEPDSAAYRYSRAWMLQRLGQAAESLPDLEAARRLAPENGRVLDLMGMAYLALDRPEEAERAFRQALERSPGDPEVVLHLGRALMALGREQEAQQWLDQYRRIRPPASVVRRKRLGMIDFATLPPEEQRRQAIERLQREARSRPDHPEFQFHLAALLLADGRAEEALREFRQLLTLQANSQIWDEAGAVLLRAGHFELARQFLERAAPERPGARLRLATALFYTEGPRAALECLAQLPEQERTGDALLLEAGILEAAGRRAEAVKVLETGLARQATDPSSVERAVLLLVRLDRGQEALELVERAAKANPQAPELPLAQAVLLGWMNRHAEAERTVKAVAARWPELAGAYLVQALLLVRSGRQAEARRLLATAALLGADEATLACAQALSAETPRAGSPDSPCRCPAGLERLLLPQCGRESL
jgi:tetratricopeptide (TPR) repeat protein